MANPLQILSKHGGEGGIRTLPLSLVDTTRARSKSGKSNQKHDFGPLARKRSPSLVSQFYHTCRDISGTFCTPGPTLIISHPHTAPSGQGGEDGPNFDPSTTCGSGLPAALSGGHNFGSPAALKETHQEWQRVTVQGLASGKAYCSGQEPVSSPVWGSIQFGQARKVTATPPLQPTQIASGYSRLLTDNGEPRLSSQFLSGSCDPYTLPKPGRSA